MSVKFHIFGTVQGVGFRPLVYRIATEMRLRGYVHNRGNFVEVCVDRDGELFMSQLMMELPPLASIEKVIRLGGDPPDDFADFQIVMSTQGESSGVSAGIPVDTALCEDCVSEMFDVNDRRYLFPFTNCTNCGARYSVTSDLPYDRKYTAMAPFHLCSSCKRDYVDPMNRRFHAQTISCPVCGPSFTVYDSRGNNIESGDWKSLKLFADLLDAGNIGVMKSWGGMHIACLFEKVWDLREWYRRREKPFAVMARDLYSVDAIGDTSPEDKEMLLHPGRPIVLLKKKKLKPPWDEVMEGISPGLDTIGVFLPYTGLHYSLFYFMESDFLLVTSANRKGEPMMIDNGQAFSLGADYYLMHDRDIINRVDDSVVKTFGENAFFIRKSRGFIPEAVRIGGNSDILAMGAEENVTISVARNGWCYPSQHIGEADHFGVLEFARDASQMLRGYLQMDMPQIVAVDMHPNYRTRTIGERLASRYNATIVEVQHHHAHAASLIVDSVDPKSWRERMAVITADGTGYGPDGSAWGGEVLLADLESFKWVGGLEKIPLIGGAKAIKHPERVAFALLDKHNIELPMMNERRANMFRSASREAPLASGFGRFLDGIAAYYNICIERTYNGEPAIKLEPYLREGSPIHDFEITYTGSPKRISTSHLLSQASALPASTRRQKADIIHSIVYKAMEALMDIVHASILDQNLPRKVGFTGGVSYNIPICQMFLDLARKRQLKSILHNSVPGGDGGISVGQCAIATRAVMDQGGVPGER